MSLRTAETAIRWINEQIPGQDKVKIVFHGGEPLLLGQEWYGRALNFITELVGDRANLSIQSNLWLLDRHYCQMFKSYSVSLGTSLDGPAWINDRQRGKRYYRRTMKGINLAHRQGLHVGTICTFTSLSAPYYKEIFDFFEQRRLSFGIHTIVGETNQKSQCLGLSLEEEGELLVNLFDLYVDQTPSIRIKTFDSIAQSISQHRNGLCTFTDCLGRYYAIGPEGYIYLCNRFAGHPEWRLGHIEDNPNEEDLSQTKAWERLSSWQAWIVEVVCAECVHLDYCKGGCPYNAIAFTKGNFRDPKCSAYKQLFGHIISRALAEVFDQGNIEAVLQDPDQSSGILRQGEVLRLMSSDFRSL